MNVAELREERGKLQHKMREILDRAEGENRDLTSEENEQFDSLHTKDEEFRSRVERQETLDSLAKEQQELRCGDHREGEFPEASAVGRDPDEQRARTDRGEKRSDEDLALEGWCLRTIGQRVGAHHHEAAKRTGRDLYLPHHDLKLLSTRELRSLRRQFDMEMRDLETGGAAGEPNIIRTDFIAQLEREMLAFGGVLQVAAQFRTEGGNPVTYPTVTDVANEAEDVDEAGDVTAGNADPTFDKITFNAFKSSTMVKYSTELEQDSGIELTGELSSLLGERIGRRLAARLTTGNGTTQAQGVVTGSTLGVTAADDVAIDSDEILELIHSVDPAYRSMMGVGFMMHDQVLLAVRKLKDNDGRYLWQPSVQAGVPSSLLGFPVFVNQSMASTVEADAKVMLFGDYRKFRVRMVRGIRLAVARELYSETDEIGMFAHIRYDAKVMQGAAIKHLVMGAYS